MKDSLGEGFSIGDTRLPWGTTPLDLGYDGPRRGVVHGRRSVDAQVGPVAVRDVRWHAPHGDRPITGVDYGLDASLTPDAVRRALEGWLGPGRTVDFPDHGNASTRVSTTTDWSFDGVDVTLSTFGAPRLEDGLTLFGRLFVRADEPRLGAPFVTRLREVDASWWQHGRVTILRAPGLSVDGRSDGLLALYRPDLRRLPPWLTLGPDQVGHWASGEWFGVATSKTTSVFRSDEALHWTRMRLRPARGPGSATLSSADGSLAYTQPGADGLDALVASLESRAGVRIQTLDDDDT